MRRRLLCLLANVSLGTLDAHAPHHAAKRIRRLGWSLRRACGGAWKNADGDGLLGRYETLYKENKAKYDEEMKTYKNSDSYKEFAAKPKESTGDRAPSFPTLALPQPGLPDSPASTCGCPGPHMPTRRAGRPGSLFAEQRFPPPGARRTLE